MGGDVDTIKEKLDIAEIISGYTKLEKSGASLKARCPFHNEKTPSFFVSPVRQNYYCFGCGAKGDIFTFVEEMEGLDFRGALKLLADKAGVELKYEKVESKTEKDKVYEVLEEATKFFVEELGKNGEATRYVESRGITRDTMKTWCIGYAPGEWRALFNHLSSLGYDKTNLLKAGLIKTSDKARDNEPYDVFRDRIIFPISDASGKVIAFSGRALAKETEPKYLNSPDTMLFTKSEVLYGLDKAKNAVRKKNYAVLVEGQMDLVLSHQSGVDNAVASSGTAFTRAHLERLKRLSPRIILAFDGDSAGEKAAEKSAELAMLLGMEVKIAFIPEGKDPAELASTDVNLWKNVLRESLPAVEFFFKKIEEKEKDERKLGKLVVAKILPLIKLLDSSIEQSHFVSMLAKRTGVKEAILWDDLKKVKPPEITQVGESSRKDANPETNKGAEPKLTQREIIEERLNEIKIWSKELPENTPEAVLLKREELELNENLKSITLREDLTRLSTELARAEKSGNSSAVTNLTGKIQELSKNIGALDEKRKIW